MQCAVNADNITTSDTHFLRFRCCLFRGRFFRAGKSDSRKTCQ